MNSKALSARKPAALVAAAMLVAATLVACGGSDNNNSADVPPAPAPVDPVDTFIAAVQAQVSIAAETTTEPIDISSLTAATNEDKEPSPI